ncbi:hypothetical protein Hanom_Chr14g01264601 [Helianthus anomalus]
MISFQDMEADYRLWHLAAANACCFSIRMLIDTGASLKLATRNEMIGKHSTN